METNEVVKHILKKYVKSYRESMYVVKYRDDERGCEIDIYSKRSSDYKQMDGNVDSLRPNYTIFHWTSHYNKFVDFKYKPYYRLSKWSTECQVVVAEFFEEDIDDLIESRCCDINSELLKKAYEKQK